MKLRLLLIMALALVLASPVRAADEPPSVVVTTEVLGSVVSELAGDAAEITVLMDAGADPHSWQPSARDSEALFLADLVVANGLDLEEGLLTVLAQAETDGVPVFHATDHVTVRPGVGTVEADHEEAAADHEHTGGDPHFWLDPLAMRDVVLALAAFMAEAGLDVADRATALAAELEALDAEISTMLAPIPDERRQLVTGHGALGYFADRYGFRIVGTVIPGLSSADEPSARDIAELLEAIRAAGTTVVFGDVGTPPSVAEAVAAESGARLVELQVAQLPESGSYADLLRDIAAAVAGALVE